MSTYKIELTIIADTENELSRDDAFALVEKIEKEFSSLRLRNIMFKRTVLINTSCEVHARISKEVE